MPVSEVCLQRMSGPSVDLGSRHAPCECASASSLNIGRIRALVMRGIPWRGITLSGALSRLDTKSPQPKGSADLRRIPAWPKFAQWRSALRKRFASASSLSWSMWAWATMTSMVEEHEWVPRGIVLVIVSLLDEAGDRPAVLVRGARQRG